MGGWVVHACMCVCKKERESVRPWVSLSRHIMRARACVCVQVGGLLLQLPGAFQAKSAFGLRESTITQLAEVRALTHSLLNVP